MEDEPHEYGFLRHWLEGAIANVDGGYEINEDYEVCAQLHRIRKTLVAVARSRAPLFESVYQRRSKRAVLKCTPLGATLRNCLNMDLEGIAGIFKGHRLDPYFTLLKDTLKSSTAAFRVQHQPTAENLNLLVEELRAGSRKKGFQRRLELHTSNARRNAKSARAYVNSLFNRYSRLLVLRLDLHYRRAYLAKLGLGISPEELPTHREKIIRFGREKLGAYVGHVWCIEWGKRKGPHYHVLIFLRGDQARQGISIAQRLGQHWGDVVTEGRGDYFNGNLREEYFESLGLRGIGMISHHDEKRRRNLDHLLTYLAKVDLFVRLEIPGMRKTFGHGRLPPKKSNAGRKRRQPGPGLIASVADRRRLLNRYVPGTSPFA
tara:strand:- start:8895 stop:10019 length:1125 start_codon:yes stop_codon:yes gene_type:complete